LSGAKSGILVSIAGSAPHFAALNAGYGLDRAPSLFRTPRLPEPRFRSRRFASRHDARANSHADERNEKEQTMPVIFLWGIPAIVVLGGGVYWIAHMH